MRRFSSGSAATTHQSPDRCASTITQFVNDGRSHRGVGSPQQTAWLFPGHLPGRPITPATLGERLRALGIYAQASRRAALLDLAAHLPAAVLADLLGIHQNTAAKWMHQTGGDWSRYAAQLANPQPSSPTLTNTSPTPAPIRGIQQGW